MRRLRLEQVSKFLKPPGRMGPSIISCNKIYHEVSMILANYIVQNEIVPDFISRKHAYHESSE